MNGPLRHGTKSGPPCRIRYHRSPERRSALGGLVVVLLGVLLTSLTLRRGSLIEDFDYRNFSFIVTWLRENGYAVSAALLALAVASLVAIPKRRLPIFNVIWLNIIFLVFLRTKDALTADSTVSVMLSVALGITVAVTFGVFFPGALRSGGIRSADVPRAIALGAGGWLGLSLFEWILSPQNTVWQGRFLGISGHPNHAGAIAAIGLLSAFILFKGAKKSRQRSFWLCVSLIFALGVLWTGSRSAMVMSVVGLAWQIVRRRHAAVCTVGLLVVLSLIIARDIYTSFPSEAVDVRIISRHNTRAEVWSVLWAEFAKNPLIGTGVAEYSENSYLVVLARSGLVGGALFGCFWFCVLRRAANMARGRGREGEAVVLRGAASIIFAIIAAGLFEGVLTDELSFPIFTAYICIGLSYAVPHIEGNGRAST